jgi:hypothetical protein
MTTENNEVPDLGTTDDGVKIVDGLPVITNEMTVGLVRTDRYRTAHDGWFDVEYAGGRRVMMNGERVTTRFRGLNRVRVAADEWAALVAEQADEKGRD